MNTIKEILKKKNINTFEIYSKVICKNVIIKTIMKIYVR